MQLLMIALPGTFAAGITQINAWIGTIIASRTTSAVSWLYYADRLYQLPLGAIGIAVGAVLLPELSRRLGRRDDAGANEAINRAAEMSMLLTLPAAAALMAIPLDILIVLFRHGVFSDADAQATAPALMAFAGGLPAYVLIKVLTPPFFARHDTRTPVVFAAVSVGVNVAGSLSLFEVIGYLGIAVSTALAAWVNVVLLSWRLVSLGHLAPDRRLLIRLAGMGGSSALMAMLLIAAAQAARDWLRGPFLIAAPALAGLVAGGIFVYGALVVLTKTVSLEEFKRAFQ
jgi:putative peptidoglycan lipid II flippase